MEGTAKKIKNRLRKRRKNTQNLDLNLKQPSTADVNLCAYHRGQFVVHMGLL